MSAVGGKELYAILGVSEKAGPEELRRAYLSLAVKYHPDRNPGDPAAEERFKDISQAYAILSDPAARARYERLRPKKSAQAARPKARPATGGGAAASAKPGQEARAKPSAASSARPSPGGKTAPGEGAAKTGAESSAGSASASKESSSAEPKETKDTSADPSSAAGRNERNDAADSDFDEVLSGFFKSDKGRETLRDLEGELKKAGIKFKAEDFAEWVRQKQKPVEPAGPAADKRSFLEKLISWLPGAEARAKKKAERHDLSYQITLSPQAAAAGTTVEISYQRDDAPRRLSIKIPAGIQDGSKLRLAGQGRAKPGGGRGDLILTIQVAQPLTVAELWK